MDDPSVAICVVTFRRPRGLQRLLGGLQQLRPPDPRCEVHVVVVDNDAEETARAVCEDAQGWLRWPLHYAVEKRRGIPQARNAAISLALPRADFVAFIDDDESPEPDWLEALLRTCAEHDADAVTGPALPAFESPPPPWIPESGLFEGPRHATGTAVSCAYTNNVLVRSSALGSLGTFFDESMALTGSTDWELFTRFAAEGHRIVWCDEARTREWIPATRATLGWLLRRALRVGSNHSRWERRAEPPHPRWRIAAHGAWCIGKGAALALLGLARGRGPAARGLALAAAGAGRLAGLSGWAYREYETTHGA